MTPSPLRPRGRRWFVKPVVGTAAAATAAAAPSDSLGFCSRLISDELPRGDDAVRGAGGRRDPRARLRCPNGPRFCDDSRSRVANTRPCGTSRSAGMTRCDAGRVSTRTDKNNRGARGRQCGVGKTCPNRTSCPKGTIWCRGVRKPASQCLPEV